ATVGGIITPLDKRVTIRSERRGHFRLFQVLWLVRVDWTSEFPGTARDDRNCATVRAMPEFAGDFGTRLGRENMLSLAALPLFAMLIGLGFRRSKPAGYAVTNSDRILVVLLSFAALGTGTTAWRVMRLGSEVDWLERVSLLLTVTAFYTGPLFLWLVRARM